MFNNQKQLFWAYLTIVFIAGIFVYCYQLGFSSLEMYDESRLAVNAIEMLQTGNFWVVTFDGKPDLWSVKPPLMIWLQVVSMKLLGVSEFSLRLPSAIAGILTTCTIFIFVSKEFKSNKLGLLAAVVLLMTPGFFAKHVVRTGDYDSLLVLFLLLQFISFYYYTRKKENKYLWILALFVYLSVMCKSIAGLFFIPGFIAFVIFDKQWQIFKTPQLYLAVCSALILILGYYLYRESLSAGYLEKVWQNELGGRFSIPQEDNSGPPWYYVKTLIQFQYRYWIWFLMVFLWPPFIRSLVKKKEIVLLTIFVSSSFFIIISKAATKLVWYDAPIFPLLAILVALCIRWLLKRIAHILSEKRGLSTKVSMPLLMLILLIFPVSAVVNAIIISPQKVKEENELKFGDFIKSFSTPEHYGILVNGYEPCVDFYERAENNKGKKVYRTSTNDKFSAGQKIAFGSKEYQDFIDQRFRSKLLYENRNFQLIEIIGPK